MTKYLLSSFYDRGLCTIVCCSEELRLKYDLSMVYGLTTQETHEHLLFLGISSEDIEIEEGSILALSIPSVKRHSVVRMYQLITEDPRVLNDYYYTGNLNDYALVCTLKNISLDEASRKLETNQELIRPYSYGDIAVVKETNQVFTYDVSHWAEFLDIKVGALQ